MNTEIQILFNEKKEPYSSKYIKEKIEDFGFGYNNAVADIIKWSEVLDKEGEVFFKCAARILTNFKMTRNGPFKGLRLNAKGQVVNGQRLKNCWDVIGSEILEIKKIINNTGCNPYRFLLNSSRNDRDLVIRQVWSTTKKILPYSMSKYSYGLVGASKILFSVLPEVILPIDNIQWKLVFKTVDIGDIIKTMTTDIELWEKKTSEKLNLLGANNKISTLPAVYNIMAMNARPKKKERKSKKESKTVARCK